MWNNLKIGTRLLLAFGGLALVVLLLLMVMALSGIGGAEQALQGATPPAQAALAQLQSARNWVMGCGVVVFVLALVATLSLRASIVAPLNQAILIAETVASGDLS